MRLNKKLINKYNNAAITVLKLYNLYTMHRYHVDDWGMIHIYLDRKQDVPVGAEYDKVLQHRFPFLLPYIQFQRHIYSEPVDLDKCEQYLREINGVLEAIAKTQQNWKTGQC